MSLNYANNKITEEQYLQGELVAEFKHEFIDGEAYAMAGASETHNLLAGNIFAELKNQLKGTPCRTFIADMKVKVANDFSIPMSWWFASKIMTLTITNNLRSLSSRYYPNRPESLIKMPNV